MEWLNVAGFSVALLLAVKLFKAVLANNGTALTEWGEFLRADALSAWMVLLISVVSLGTSLYAVRYFRRDLAGGDGDASGAFREFYVLTPLFSAGMFLVVLANNLGVMWIAVEATALSSVLLVALYNRKTSLEAAWKYIMLGSLGPGAGAVRHGLCLCGGRWQNAARALPSFNWSHLVTVAAQFDPRLDQTGVSARARRLRHQGRPGADAHLAARRAQRSAVAHQRDAFRRVAQDRHLRAAAISHSHHRVPATPGSAATCCWASGCFRCCWPRRSFSCRATSNGCWPIPASNTSA